MNEKLRLEMPSHQFLSQLARQDPEAYEALRQALIEDLIGHARADMQPRLRGLQFRIDCVRRLSHSTLGSTLKIQALMWESFHRLNAELSRFSDPPSPAREEGMKAAAEVIEFRPRQQLH